MRVKLRMPYDKVGQLAGTAVAEGCEIQAPPKGDITQEISNADEVLRNWMRVARYNIGTAMAGLLVAELMDEIDRELKG